MRCRPKYWFPVFLGVFTLFPAGCRANHSHVSAATYNMQTKVLLRAPGVVMSVDAKPHDEQIYDLLPGARVCYTISSFAAIPNAQRAAYESAERARLAVQGPRCRDTSIDQSAVHIKVGDPVDINFTLENAGQIAVVSVYTQGLEL